jgi:2-phospho-L-lactate/phosphoenolpyruvate guanylyltransferase
VSDADLSRIVAVVPVRSLSGAKTRLGEPLDPEERQDLILALLRQTVASALGSRRLDRVAVVSKDPELLREARGMGAASLLQRSDGLNEGLVEARDAVCPEATAMLVLPADLPRISTDAIDRLVQAAAETMASAPGRPVVALVADRHGTGTNALLIAPPNAIPFRFGEGSRSAHSAAAIEAGAAYVELDGPLAFDVDTPDDLLEADMGGLDHEAGR